MDWGPYRFVRHPAYTGLLVIYIGLGFVTQSLGGALVLIVYFEQPSAIGGGGGGFNIKAGRRIRRVRKENEQAYSVRSLNTLCIFSPSVPSVEVRAIK